MWFFQLEHLDFLNIFFCRSSDKLKCWIEKWFVLKSSVVGGGGSHTKGLACLVTITSIVKYTFIILNITFPLYWVSDLVLVLNLAKKLKFGPNCNRNKTKQNFIFKKLELWNMSVTTTNNSTTWQWQPFPNSRWFLHDLSLLIRFVLQNSLIHLPHDKRIFLYTSVLIHN